MDLETALAEQLETARRIITSGHVVVPAWRIGCPDGQFLILTRFDEAEPEQRERALALVGRFMAWKLATAFVFTAEGTGRDDLDAEHDYLHGVCVTRGIVIGARQRIDRTAATRPPYTTSITWGAYEPFVGRDAVDPLLLALLPSGPVTVSDSEARLLASLFGEDGELPAHRLN